LLALLIFLVRREGKSDLGDYYEAWDTKLSKTTRPYFIVQLCCYSWMLEEIPEEAVRSQLKTGNIR